MGWSAAAAASWRSRCSSYALGEPLDEATVTALAVVAAAALVGALPHAHARRVHFPIAAAMAAAGVLGASGGSVVGRRLAEPVLLVGFALLALTVAVLMLRTSLRPTAAELDDVAPRDRVMAAVAPVGFGVGFLTGVFGVGGGGFLIVPALTLVARVPVRCLRATGAGDV